MKLTLSTYNSTSITTYLAKLNSGPFVSRAKIIDVDRVNDSVAFAGKSYEPREIEISFTVSDANFNSYSETIAKIFNTKDTTLRNLVALDSADSNTQYYVECTPIKFKDGRPLTIVVWTPDPVWKKVTASTKTINVAFRVRRSWYRTSLLPR